MTMKGIFTSPTSLTSKLPITSEPNSTNAFSNPVTHIESDIPSLSSSPPPPSYLDTLLHIAALDEFSKIYPRDPKYLKYIPEMQELFVKTVLDLNFATDKVPKSLVDEIVKMATLFKAKLNVDTDYEQAVVPVKNHIALNEHHDQYGVSKSCQNALLEDQKGYYYRHDTKMIIFMLFTSILLGMFIVYYMYSCLLQVFRL